MFQARLMECYSFDHSLIVYISGSKANESVLALAQSGNVVHAWHSIEAHTH